MRQTRLWSQYKTTRVFSVLPACQAESDWSAASSSHLSPHLSRWARLHFSYWNDRIDELFLWPPVISGRRRSSTRYTKLSHWHECTTKLCKLRPISSFMVIQERFLQLDLIVFFWKVDLTYRVAKYDIVFQSNVHPKPSRNSSHPKHPAKN